MAVPSKCRQKPAKVAKAVDARVMVQDRNKHVPHLVLQAPLVKL